jgi:transposase
VVAWFVVVGSAARIVLGCTDPGVSDEKVAVDVGVSPMTVQVWRRRFAEDRLAGLIDRQRPGRPKADLVLSPVEREQLTRWSRRAKSSQALALRAPPWLAGPPRP